VRVRVVMQTAWAWVGDWWSSVRLVRTLNDDDDDDDLVFCGLKGGEGGSGLGCMRRKD
jgi:hypothetical protein